MNNNTKKIILGNVQEYLVHIQDKENIDNKKLELIIERLEDMYPREDKIVIDVLFDASFSKLIDPEKTNIYKLHCLYFLTKRSIKQISTEDGYTYTKSCYRAFTKIKNALRHFAVYSNDRHIMELNKREILSAKVNIFQYEDSNIDWELIMNTAFPIIQMEEEFDFEKTKKQS